MAHDASSPSPTPPELHVVETAPPSRGLPFGRVIIIALGISLVGWTALRVRTAQSEQSRMLTERAAAAESAKKERKDKPLVLRTGSAATWRPLIRIEGTLQAAEEADLAFKIGGRLRAIRVKVGDAVKRGQQLAFLEQTESAAAVEQARAQLRAAEAQLTLAKDMETRTTALVASGAGSQQAALQTREQRALVAAQADATRAGLTLAQANLESGTLVAPFPGFVTRVPSGAGQVVAPGATLFHLQNTGVLKLVGTVNETDVSLVRPGEQLRVLGPDGVVVGEVTAVLGSVDAATRRVPIEARVPNDPQHLLLAGTYVRAEIEGKVAVPVLRFPAGVIRPGSQNEVMVADGGRLRARRVVFHAAPDGMIFVRSGLDAHDVVVVDPSPEAKDGDVVPVGSQAQVAAK